MAWGMNSHLAPAFHHLERPLGKMVPESSQRGTVRGRGSGQDVGLGL